MVCELPIGSAESSYARFTKAPCTNSCLSTALIAARSRSSRIPRCFRSSIISSLSISKRRTGFPARNSLTDRFGEKGLDMIPHEAPDGFHGFIRWRGQPGVKLVPELLCRESPDEDPVIGDRNPAGLLRDDDRHDVRLLGNPERGAMPHPEYV